MDASGLRRERTTQHRNISGLSLFSLRLSTLRVPVKKLIQQAFDNSNAVQQKLMNTKIEALVNGSNMTRKVDLTHCYFVVEINLANVMSALCPSCHMETYVVGYSSKGMYGAVRI